MKYADGPTVSASIAIDAPAVAVWEIVSDITMPTRFSTEVSTVEWIDGASGPASGARFRGHSAHDAIGEWETTCQVTALEEPRVFEWIVVGESGGPASTWRFTIDDAGGSVTLTQWLQMGPERGGLNLAIDRMPDKEDRIVERRLAEHRANMERNLLGVKQLAEAVAG